MIFVDDAWNSYNNSCTCGIRYENNCAHYLSNALIKGGFHDLDGGTGANFREVDGRIVCRTGRPVRAKEMRAWFKKIGTQHNTQPEGVISLVYQERKRDGQGHVLLKKGNEHRGTGDYPDWEIQEFYTV